MTAPRKVIDAAAVLGVKVSCETVPAANMEVEPITVEIEFSPGANGFLHVHPEQDESY